MTVTTGGFVIGIDFGNNNTMFSIKDLKGIVTCHSAITGMIITVKENTDLLVEQKKSKKKKLH